MRKNIWKWTALLVAAIVSVGFVSCGNDDVEDNKPKGSDSVPSLVGVWEYKEEGMVIWFEADGDGYLYESANAGKLSRFTYELIEQRVVVMTYADLKTDEWEIFDFDDQKLVFVFNEFARATFVKCTFDELVGTWRYEHNGEVGVIVFRADGTGYRSVMVAGQPVTVSFNYIYDASAHVVQTFIDANTKALWRLEDFDGKSFVLDGDQYVKQ